MKIDRFFWRELGVYLFLADCNEGEAFSFTAPLREMTLDTPTVPVVAAGRFRGECAWRDAIEWPALPTRTEGGIAFPGNHRLTALEPNSIYACVAAIPGNSTEVTPDMFGLDHDYLDTGLSVAYSHGDGYRAVIVMSGAVVAGGDSFGPGSKILVPADGALEIAATEAAHLVGYRDTSAT